LISGFEPGEEIAFMADVSRLARDYGITPVPAQERRLGFLDMFVLWADLGVSFLVMVVGMFLVPGLSLGGALAAILVGAILGNLLLGLVATMGSDSGVPTMVLFRPVLGLRGSYAPTVLNVLQLVGWATFEVIVMAQAATLLSQRLLGAGGYLGWVALFTLLTTLMALGGPVLIVKQWMEKFAVWAVLITVVWLTLAYAAVGRADAALIASMVHYGTYAISEIKSYLSRSGVPVRNTW
jgi:purine-cytosine permease-like protein